MTQGRPDRLDRIETALDNQVTVNAELRATAEALLQTVIIHQQNFEAIITRFDTMQSEIRGLQTENRRILERLEHLENGEQQ